MLFEIGIARSGDSNIGPTFITRSKLFESKLLHTTTPKRSPVFVLTLARLIIQIKAVGEPISSHSEGLEWACSLSGCGTLAGGCASKASLRRTGVHCTYGLISPCSGHDCVKSLRSSYMGLYPQRGEPRGPLPKWVGRSASNIKTLQWGGYEA